MVDRSQVTSRSAAMVGKTNVADGASDAELLLATPSGTGCRHFPTVWVLIRGLLLAAVLSGIFGMHVLTAEDGSGAHGALPLMDTGNHPGIVGMKMVGTGSADNAMVPTAHADDGASEGVAAARGVAGSIDSTENADAPTAMTPWTTSSRFLPDSGSGMGHGDMAGCILFVVAAATALLLALLRHRRMIESPEPVRRPTATLTDLRRRGPPARCRPRIALCVIRI